MAEQYQVEHAVTAVKGAAEALGCVPNFATSQAGLDQVTALATLVTALQALITP